MGYTNRALHKVGSSDVYVFLPDIYQNIERAVGLKKVEEGEGRMPVPLGAALSAGKVRKFKVRVQVSQNEFRNRTLICANDFADQLGGVIGKTLPTNGDVEGGTIKSVRLPRRRIWP